MTSPRFVTKIVGGKLVTVPDYRGLPSSRQSGLSATYPWGKYDPSPTFKIGGASHPVLPPISEGKQTLNNSSIIMQKNDC